MLHATQDSYNFHMMLYREFFHVWFFNKLSIQWLEFDSPHVSSVQALYHPAIDTEFHEKIQNLL